MLILIKNVISSLYLLKILRDGRTNYNCYGIPARTCIQKACWYIKNKKYEKMKPAFLLFLHTVNIKYREKHVKPLFKMKKKLCLTN